MSIVDQYHRDALMILVTNAYKHIFDRGKKEEIVDGRKDNPITNIIVYKRIFKITKFYILTTANPLNGKILPPEVINSVEPVLYLDQKLRLHNYMITIL